MASSYLKSRKLLWMAGSVALLACVITGTHLLLCPGKGIDDITKGFPLAQAKMDELARLFEERSKVGWIALGTWGSVSLGMGRQLYVGKGGVPEEVELIGSVVWDAQINSEPVGNMLRDTGMDRNDFEKIISTLKQVGASKVGFYIEDGRKKAVAISYRDRCFCAWRFLRPKNEYGMAEIAKKITVDRREGEAGPYILNDKWLVYRECTA